MGKKIDKTKPIKDIRKLQMTAYKRKKGLVKKAMELSMICAKNVLLVILDGRNSLIYCSLKDYSKFINYLQNKSCIKDEKEYHNEDYFNKFQSKEQVCPCTKTRGQSQSKSEDNDKDEEMHIDIDIDKQNDKDKVIKKNLFTIQHLDSTIPFIDSDANANANGDYTYLRNNKKVDKSQRNHNINMNRTNINHNQHADKAAINDYYSNNETGSGIGIGNGKNTDCNNTLGNQMRLNDQIGQNPISLNSEYSIKPIKSTEQNYKDNSSRISIEGKVFNEKSVSSSINFSLFFYKDKSPNMTFEIKPIARKESYSNNQYY